MLVMWTVELYLSQLTQIKHQQTSTSQTGMKAAEVRQSLHDFLDDAKVKVKVIAFLSATFDILTCIKADLFAMTVYGMVVCLAEHNACLM